MIQVKQDLTTMIQAREFCVEHWPSDIQFASRGDPRGRDGGAWENVYPVLRHVIEDLFVSQRKPTIGHVIPGA